jgi:invasion protein IalB
MSHALSAAFALLLLGAAAAQAQTPPALRPPEVKSIGDWSVRCFPQDSPSPCDMYEELDDKNTRQRVLGISIAYIPKMDRHALVVTVPLGVSIPKGVVIQTDTFTSAPLHYRRCDRNGCYVEMLIDDASIGSLSKSGPEGKVKIVADGGKPFDLRFSLNGFTAAHDSMAAQAKEKAKDPAPAPAK